MAQVTLSGKVQRVYEGRRFTNLQGQPTDAISFDLCVSREGADERTSLLGGDQKNKCDFYRCHLYGKKAVDFYNLTLNNPRRIVTITGNMLQDEKPCFNRNIRFGKDNPLYPLLAQYAQASNGVIDLQANGDIWVKGDYIYDKAVKVNVHSFNFLDNPNAQNNQFGMELAPNNTFGGQQPFAGNNQGNNGQFGANTAGTFGAPAQNTQFGGAQPTSTGGFPTQGASAQTGGFPTQGASATTGGFPASGSTGGFPATNNTTFAPSNNGFEVANPQPQQSQVAVQGQAVGGFPQVVQEPVMQAPVQQVAQANSAVQAPVETNIPAPQSAMEFTPAQVTTNVATSGDNTRPF